eukprot:SM000023S07669  [mRNA]  locus=s23:771645:773447:- [translate_table: standard]
MSAGPHYDDRMGSQRPRSRRRSVHPASEAVVEVAVPASGGKPGAPWLEASRASAGQDRYGGISPGATDQAWDTDAGYLDRLPPPPRAHDELDYDFSAGLAHSQAREELGVATWTLLHTLAAQFPDKPTKQQQRDVKDLMGLMTRIYPCKQCADHFKEVLKSSPPQTGSGVELAQWMCRVHNIVNRSLDKPQFPCRQVDARWGALDCGEEGACSLEGR